MRRKKKIATRGAVILYQLHPFIAPNRSLIFYAELKIKNGKQYKSVGC